VISLCGVSQKLIRFTVGYESVRVGYYRRMNEAVRYLDRGLAFVNKGRVNSCKIPCDLCKMREACMRWGG